MVNNRRCIQINQVIILNAYLSPKYPNIINSWKSINLNKPAVSRYGIQIR